MAATPAIRYAPEDPTLPKPWRGLVDGKTGYLYFWNPETNVTQYERPSSSHGSSAAHKPVTSTDHVQRSSQEQRHETGSHDDGDRYNGGSNGSSSRFSSGTANNQPNRSASGHSSDAVAKAFASSDNGSGLSAEAYCRRHEITVIGNDVPQPFMSFEATGFPSEVLRELKTGFIDSLPIQAQSWPLALQGRDMVAIAKTGSGKTLGYLLPGFMHLKQRGNNPRMGPTVLVLSPTRELATQIQDEALKFGRSSRISCTCLYGGAPKGPQLKDLDRGVDVVVATPGRLNDILEMKRISLHQISYLVLDEADRMLDMGFEPQIRKIVKEVPARRQTLMYTATWPKEVRKIAADLLVNPVQVNIGNVDELVANKSITQYVEMVPSMEKQRRVEQILRSQEPGSKIIIFCSTKKMCDQLSRNLNRGFGAAAIHGDKSQADRDYVLNQFRSGRSPILVATDVAARGLDVKDIRVVINYDFPTGVEDYVHRIGRTGRAGATGEAYTFFGDQDAKHASDLVKVLEGANQRVPSELRGMSSYGGGMGRAKRQWGSGPGGHDGGRGGGRYDSGYSGRDVGRSNYGMSGGDRDSRERYGQNSYNRDEGGGGGYRSFHENMMQTTDKRNRSRSPTKGVGANESWSKGRSRSRSPNRFDRSPPRSQGRSFHEAMMEREGGIIPAE
ncbi:hypothetical protein Leryth_023781 [Lithospermum erythrorhizon]|nr:hypothetical protein Leryth_023781 [Lithospermum erythrorhizon]